jgi:hypothetical protein
MLVGPFDDLEVAALLAWPVQNNTESPPVALECKDRYALDLAFNDHVLADATFPKTEDVLVTARPTILDEKRQYRLRPPRV